MKIAILTSGILPVPAVMGGAVETHIDFYLNYNNLHQIHDITVYSIWNKAIRNHPALNSSVNHYYYVKVNNLWAKFKKKLYHRLYGDGYYHYTIEFYFREAWKHLKKEQYDIILLDNRPGYAINIKLPKNVRLFYYLHNDLLNKNTDKAVMIYNAATRIITVSDYISNCVKTINANDHKCITVHNGIDIKAFARQKASNISRSQVGLSNDDFVIYFSGRLIPEKGVLELIKAIKKLVIIPNLKLLIIGGSFYGNSNNDNRFVRELKEESASVSDRIIFTGYIPYLELPNYLWFSDVAIVPSIWEEPFGNTIVEAMAAGLPLITTRSGGIPEICDGIAMFIDREDIVENLANAILYLYKHPEKRDQMAKAGITRSKLFDEETYAKNFFKAFEDE